MARKTKNSCIAFLNGKQIVFDLPVKGELKDGQKFLWKGEEFKIMQIGIGSKEHILWFGYRGEYKTALAGAWLMVVGSDSVL